MGGSISLCTLRTRQAVQISPQITNENAVPSLDERPPLHTGTPLPSAQQRQRPHPLPRSCGAITKLSIQTALHKNYSPKKLDNTPTTREEKLRFLFYCPICFCYHEGGARCTNCQHHCCFDCCAELMYLASDKISQKHDVLKCPHCRQHSTMEVVKNSSDIIRTYHDSPQTVARKTDTLRQEAANDITQRSLDVALAKVVKKLQQQTH